MKRWMTAGAISVAVLTTVVGITALGWFHDNEEVGGVHRFRLNFQGESRDQGEAVLDVDNGELCLLSGEDDPEVRAAQIHKDPAGPILDPVVISIFEPPGSLQGKLCVSAPSDVLADIIEHPGDYYVDYHYDPTGERIAWSLLIPSE